MPLTNFPFTTVSTPGDRAEQLLLQMRAALQPRGQAPMTIGDPQSASRFIEAWNYEEFSFEDALGVATGTQPQEWFQQRIDEDPETFSSLFVAEVYPKAAVPPGTVASVKHESRLVPGAAVARATAHHSFLCRIWPEDCASVDSGAEHHRVIS